MKKLFSLLCALLLLIALVGCKTDTPVTEPTTETTQETTETVEPVVEEPKEEVVEEVVEETPFYLQDKTDDEKREYYTNLHADMTTDEFVAYINEKIGTNSLSVDNEGFVIVSNYKDMDPSILAEIIFNKNFKKMVGSGTSAESDEVDKILGIE